MVWHKGAFLVEVEHVGTPHEESFKQMSHFEKFITEGNEKADELARGGALLDKEFMKEARAETIAAGKRGGVAALQHAASFHCFVEKWKGCEELKPKPKEKLIFVDKMR